MILHEEIHSIILPRGLVCAEVIKNTEIYLFLDDARQHSSSNMVIMLIGNKSDLER